MRFLKAIWLAIFFVLSILFFMQNQEALGAKLNLSFDTYYLNYVWKNTAVPFYAVVLFSFLAGAFVMLGYLVMNNIHLRNAKRLAKKEAKKLKKENDKLKEENNKLRALPLETSLPSAEKTEEAAPAAQ